MADDATKRCNTCGETKPLDQFHRMSDSSDGHQYVCKQCRAEKAARVRAERPEDVRARQRRYRERNRETLRAKGRAYIALPENRERARERYLENREEVLARQRQYQDANRDLIRERNRQSYWANPELARERVRRRASEVRAQVFGHYGTACACCSRTDDLSIDHIAGDGRQHRDELFGRQGGGVEFYLWLITRGFPEGYQTLCRPCNGSKATGTRCRLKH